MVLGVAGIEDLVDDGVGREVGGVVVGAQIVRLDVSAHQAEQLNKVEVLRRSGFC